MYNSYNEIAIITLLRYRQDIKIPQNDISINSLDVYTKKNAKLFAYYLIIALKSLTTKVEVKIF